MKYNRSIAQCVIFCSEKIRIQVGVVRVFNHPSSFLILYFHNCLITAVMHYFSDSMYWNTRDTAVLILPITHTRVLKKTCLFSAEKCKLPWYIGTMAYILANSFFYFYLLEESTIQSHMWKKKLIALTMHLGQWQCSV